MSEPVEKRRPLIDLDEFERRLRLQFNADAETSGAVDGQDLYGRGPLVPRTDESLKSSSHDASTPDFRIEGDFAAVEAGLLGLIEPASHAGADISFDAEAARSQPLPPLRAVRGDFAEIEAALLGGASQPIFAPKSDEPDPGEGAGVKPLPGLDPSERYMIAGGLQDRSAEEEIRSRRTLYIMAAIVVVGLGGIAAKFQSGFSGGPHPSQVAEALPDTPLAAAAASRSRLPDDAFSSSNEPKPASAADAGQTASLADAAPGAAATSAPPPSADQGAGGVVSAPAAAGEANAPLQAALDPPLLPPESKPLAAALETAVAPAPVSGLAPTVPDAPAKPVAPVKSATAPATVSHATPVAKTAAAKPAHAAVAPKQAADGAKPRAQTAHTATAANKPKPVAARDASTHATQTAEAPPEQTSPAPVQAANPAINGVSSIMQMAVNSVNNAVKMLDWRRHDSGANP